ncbi:MAG: Gfo/Idh/MocA family oxidoreductase [Desulfatibacillaceae bacterium]
MSETGGNQPGIAVVGSGYWGRNLVRNYSQLGALRLICDTNATVLENFREQYPGVETVMAYTDVLARDDIEGVVIATPAETHYNLAREALLAGKHVYVEKPLVLRESEGRDLIETARSGDLVLMVGHLLQYHPVFLRLKEMAAAGDLGRINYIYSHRLNLGKLRREENVLWSFAPHDISMILALAGEEPEFVHATGANYLHKNIADVTTTHMEFASGLNAHIFVSWLHPFKEQKLVVVGDRKMAVFDDTQPWEDKLLLYPHEIVWKDNVPVPAKADAERVDIPRSEPLRDECRHFMACIREGSRPQTDGEEGLRVLRILNAAQQSLDGQSTRINPRAHVPDAVAGEGADFFAHPTAVVDNGVKVGKGAKIWHFSHILKGSVIGGGTNIGQNVVVGPDVSVGQGCKIQNNVSVYKGVTLEDHVFCGPSMVFTNVFNPRAAIPRMDQVRPTLVRKGTTIGANATIVCGITLGRYSFVGAGAVVVRNVRDHALVVGNPARRIGWMCECGERLGDDLACVACDRAYKELEHGLVSLDG